LNIQFHIKYFNPFKYKTLQKENRMTVARILKKNILLLKKLFKFHPNLGFS